MRKGALLTLFLVVFLDLVGFGIVIPILPYYAQAFGATGWTLGWLMTSYSLMQFFFAPVWGGISDRYGRRPVLMFSILGSVLSLLILAQARSLEWLFAGRILAGLFGANISTAYAYVTDVTDEKSRAKGMGIIGAGFGLGFIFGPAIGGILAGEGDYARPMLAGAALAAVNLALAWFKLEEPPLSAEARAANRFKRFDLEGVRRVLTPRATRLAVLLFLLLTFAVTQLEVTFALFMQARYGLGALGAGMLLAVMGVTMALMQGGLVGRLAPRYGERRLVLVGSGLGTVALAAFAGAPGLGLAVAALVGLAIGHGMLHPSLSSLASFGAPADQRGATMGVFQSAGSLARILGPLCAGFLYDRAGQTSPFYFGALVLAAVFALMFLSRNDGDARTAAL